MHYSAVLDKSKDVPFLLVISCSKKLAYPSLEAQQLIQVYVRKFFRNS